MAGRPKGSKNKETAGTKDKRGNFLRIANKRCANALKQIRSMGKLSNKNNYEYSDTDVNKLVWAITKELEAMEARFKGSTGPATIEDVLS